ncbi:MAG: acyloxyacyl hydrolase [Bacteroidales bacterium]|jgi:hypothetical protein|nr:acyloxyacyl hydrolase [Bacteroidales bacterium]
MRRYILPISLIFYIVCSHTAFSQIESFKKNMLIEGKVLYGSILPHYSFMNYLISEHQKGLEIQIRTHTNRKAYSSFAYRYPNYGIGFNHISLGNPEKLGNASALFGVLDIPLFHKRFFSLYYQFNLGGAYIHKPLETTIYNIAMSNYINFFIGVDLYAEYRIAKQHAIRAGIDLSHISNGKITTPNLGYNSMALSCSYIHHIHHTPGDVVQYNTKTIASPSTITFIVSGGVKSDEYLSPERFPTGSLNIEYHKIFTYKYGAVVGFDLFYDKSKANTESIWKNQINGGVHLGGEAFYFPFSFSVQTGWYLLNKPEKHTTYQRIALRYYGMQSYIIQFGLKTHGTTADFLELGVGYTIQNIRKHVSEIEQN